MLNKLAFVQFVFLALIHSSEAQGDDKKKACNIGLMNTFQLEGHVAPRFNQTIEICGNVRDNCCTLYDQMKIVKMWKEYTRPVITHKVNQIVSLYNSIFDYHYYFAALPLESLPMYFTAERWVPYYKKVCHYTYANDSAETQFTEGLHLTKKTKSTTKNSHRKLLEANSTLSIAGNATAFGLPERNLLDEVPLLSTNMTKSVKIQALRNFERYLLDRKHEAGVKQIVLTKTQVDGLKKIQFIQNDFHKAVHRSLGKIIKHFASKLNTLNQLKAKIEEPLNIVKNELEIVQSNPDYLRTVARKMAQQLPSDDVFNVTKLNQLYTNSFITDEQAKMKLTEKRDELEKMINKINEQTSMLMKFQQHFLAQKMKVNFDNKEMATLIKMMARAGVPKIPVKAVPKMRIRMIPSEVKIQTGKFECQSKKRQFYRKFYIINSKKYKYCDNILWAVKKFDMQTFMLYLRNVRETLDYMVSLRKSLYCALCDLNMQRYFDFKNNIVAFNEAFCDSYIFQFAEYFKWKNVLFVEYLNYIFQLIQCFDSPGSAIDFPFQTMIDKHHKQTFFFKRCFDNMDHEDRFKYCHFICKEFRYESMTSFIEGDVKFLKEVLALMFSFIRKQNVETSKEILKKMNSAKKIDIPRFHHDPKVAEDIEDMIKKEETVEYMSKKSELPLTSTNSKTAKISKKKTGPARVLAETGEDQQISEIESLKEETDKARKLIVEELEPPKELSNVVMDRAGAVFERRLSSDFILKPIYQAREIKPVLSNLRAFFYKDWRGLNPMLLESLTNFDFDLHEYLASYVKRISKESLSMQVLNTALQVIPLEKTFNTDLSFDITDGEGKPINSQSPTVNPILQQSAQEVLAAKLNNKDHLKAFFPSTQSEAGPGQYAREGVPELELLMNL